MARRRPWLVVAILPASGTESALDKLTRLSPCGTGGRTAEAVRNGTPSVAASSFDHPSGTLMATSSPTTQYSAALPIAANLPP